MSSILATVFKATIGLLVDKGTNVKATILQEGGVTDHEFRRFVVREIHRGEHEMGEGEDLKASYGHFKEGVIHFFKVLDKSQTKTKERHAFEVPYAESTTPTTPTSEILISKYEDSIPSISKRLVSSDETPWRSLRRDPRPTFKEPMASTDEAFQLPFTESSPSPETTLSTKEAFQVPNVENSPPTPRKRISTELVSLDGLPSLLKLNKPSTVHGRSRNSAEESQTFCEIKARPLLPNSMSTRLKNLKLAAELDDSKTALSCAKREFKDAYLKATEAFNNEDLSQSGRIQAMAIRVAATILEKVEYPEDALAPCMLYLEELHSMPAVQVSFSVGLSTGFEKGFLSRSRKGEYGAAVISSVCHMNRVIYDVMQIVGEVNRLMTWPCVTTAPLKKLLKRSSDAGEEKVDPLRDSRMTNVLRELGMEHYCVTPWSFGQEGEDEQKLKDPRGIVTSSKGQFIIADHGDHKVKVFDRCGKFKSSLCLPPAGEGTKLDVRDVAIDRNGCLYVLAGLQNSAGDEATGVCVFEKSGRIKHTFLLRKGLTGWNLTVDDNSKVLVTSSSQTIEVLEPDGKPISSFGVGTLKTDAFDITTAKDGRVMVSNNLHSDIQVFNQQGDPVFNFNLDGSYHTHDSCPKIAFHQASEHLVVAGIEKKKFRLDMLIYTKNGEFVRRIQYGKERIDNITGITVTTEGRFAAAVRQVDSEGHGHFKVLVV